MHENATCCGLRECKFCTVSRAWSHVLTFATVVLSRRRSQSWRLHDCEDDEAVDANVHGLSHPRRVSREARCLLSQEASACSVIVTPCANHSTCRFEVSQRAMQGMEELSGDMFSTYKTTAADAFKLCLWVLDNPKSKE